MSVGLALKIWLLAGLLFLAGPSWASGPSECEKVIYVDFRPHLIYRGKPVHLPKRELRLAQFLMNHPTRVFSYEELYAVVFSKESVTAHGKDYEESQILPLVVSISKNLGEDRIFFWGWRDKTSKYNYGVYWE